MDFQIVTHPYVYIHAVQLENVDFAIIFLSQTWGVTDFTISKVRFNSFHSERKNFTIHCHIGQHSPCHLYQLCNNCCTGAAGAGGEGGGGGQGGL